jgi:O-Antigen ligase
VSTVVKSLITGAFGLLLAVILGYQVGHGSWTVPILIAGGCIGIFLYVGLFKTVRIEALILGFLLFGYIVGNRGFAQLSIKPNSPLYLGELGMLACLFLIAMRRALTRERLIPRIPLAWAIAAFLLIGGLRLYLDTVMTNTSNMVTLAIRDSAVVYYAFFFFIAYQIGKNESARKFVERAILTGFVLLIPVAVVAIWANELFNKLTYHDFPLILYKGDLLTTFLGIGAFYFFFKPSRGILKVFFRACSLASLTLMLFGMSRAALSGFACAVVLLIVARRSKFILYQIGVAVVALLAIAFLQLSNIHFESDFFRNLSDKVTSIADFSGTGHYHSKIGDSSAANNEFRTVWWTTVFNETMQKGPFFGLGFGYDLTAGFLRTYYSNQNPDLTARSPHSILLTALGRMGVIGLASFLVILFLIIRMAFQGARSVARGQQPQENLAHWCALINLLGAALFGVVLEGPMGGILFWSVLGLAASQLSGVKEQDKDLPEPTPQRTLEPALAETALVSRRGSV